MYKNFKSISDNNIETVTLQELFNMLFGDDNVSTTTRKKTNTNKTQNKQTQQQDKYVPQIGDKVVVENGVMGINGNITGKIIAEVKDYNKYQVQLDEFNAIYVDKDKVKVIQRKIDTEKIEEINKLKEEIRILSDEKIKLCDKLDMIEDKIDELYKKLEELED